MTPAEAYKHVDNLFCEDKPLEVDQVTLNALAMHDLARVHLFDKTPPLVAEVAVSINGEEHVVRRILLPVPAKQRTLYEHRGLMCEVHGQAAHRRERFATGPWTCCECSPSEVA